MRVATIDVGTNSILLLIAETREHDLVPVDDRCRIERLGQGVDRTGRLDNEAIARSLEALGEYSARIDAARVDKVGAVGTQALREAENGNDFLDGAEEVLGVPIEVIGGEREAALAFTAVRRSFPHLSDLVVMDVGGGSTELIVANDGKIESLQSVPIGSVRLTERFLASDPPTEAEAAAMNQRIDGALASLPLPRGIALVGTAGTVTTLGAAKLELEPYDAERVHGMKLTKGEVAAQVTRYLSVDNAARRQIPGVQPGRADVIAAGASIVLRVMERMGAEELIVSDRGIRWGLAYELTGS